MWSSIVFKLNTSIILYHVLSYCFTFYRILSNIFYHLLSAIFYCLHLRSSSIIFCLLHIFCHHVALSSIFYHVALSSIIFCYHIYILIKYIIYIHYEDSLLLTHISKHPPPPDSATTRFVCSFGQHDIHRELANRNLRLKLGELPKGLCSMFQGRDHLVLWMSWQEDKLSRPSYHLQPAKDRRGSCCWVLSLLHTEMNNDKYNPITGVKV